MESNHRAARQKIYSLPCYHLQNILPFKELVESPGNDPGSSDFQSATYTMYAMIPKQKTRSDEDRA